MSAYLEKVTSIVREMVQWEEAPIDANTDLVYGLGFDSIDYAELILGIEEEWQVVVTPETAATWEKVGDICEFLEENLISEDD